MCLRFAHEGERKVFRVGRPRPRTIRCSSGSDATCSGSELRRSLTCSKPDVWGA
jgi:hypothetical protein